MSSEIHDPILGMPERDDSSSSSSPSRPLKPTKPPTTKPGPQGASAPIPPPVSTSSGDELSAILTDSIVHPEPDPFLGSFSGEASSRAEPGAAMPPGGEPGHPPEGGTDPSAGLAFPLEAAGRAQASGSLPLDLGLEIHAENRDRSDTPSSFEGLSALAAIAGLESSQRSAADPGTKPSSTRTEASRSREDEESDEVEDEEEDEEDSLASRRSWLILLLVSYASAVTIGLIWVLVSGRHLREGDDVNLLPATANQLDPGQRADRSRKVVPPDPLAADHLTALGQTIRLNSLEVTPLEVTSGRVALEGAFDNTEHRDGGSDALRLKIRLKNISPDSIFVPLDEAFLRERIVGRPDSFIETANHGLIAMYPLAISSEWAIQGQMFQELQPGESCQALVVSSTKVSDRLSPEMTWRIRLRTGIDQTDTIGVRFRKNEIR